MAITVIQTANINAGGTSTSASVGFSGGCTGGNLLVAAWRVTAGSPVITITDSAGNTWNTITQSASSVVGMAWAPVTHPGTNTLTWHTVSAGYARVVFAEIYYGSSGVTNWTQPNSSGSAIGATTTPNSGSISDLTTDVLLGAAANQTDSTSITTAFTLITQLSTADPGLYFKTPTGSDAFSGTSASASWGIMVANFTPTLSSGSGAQSIFC